MAERSEHPRVAADVAVFAYLSGAMHVLLVRRRYEPYESYWALPGGGIESDRDARGGGRARAARGDGRHRHLHGAARDLLGGRPRPARTRDLVLLPGARRRRTRPARARDRTPARRRGGRSSRCSRRWRERGVLAFDHDDILRYARQRLAYKLEYQNVAWGLLPDAFTMSGAAARLRGRHRPRVRAEQLPPDRARVGGARRGRRAGHRRPPGRPLPLRRPPSADPGPERPLPAVGVIAAAPNELLVDEYELAMADSYLAEGKDSAAGRVRALRARAAAAPRLPGRRRPRAGGGGADRAALRCRGALAYLERARICSPALLAQAGDRRVHRRSGGGSRGHGGACPRADPARRGRPPDVPARRDAAPEPGELPDADRHEGQPDRDRRRGPAGGRLRVPARARRRRRHPRARAAYIGGCAATATVAAGYLYGVPTTGTMAHSYILSFPTDVEAFVAFLRHHPRALDAPDRHPRHRWPARTPPSQASRETGIVPQAVRIDSGDLVTLTARCASVLDGGGLGATQIVCSGDLDEYRIADLLADGARDRRLRGRHGAHDLERRAGAGRRLQARRVGRARL